MLINKKNILAAALLAGLGLTGAASAFTLDTNGNAAPVLVATADIITTATDIGINEIFTVSLTGSDLILGRTTGFTIRYTLSNGATFGSAITNADLTTDTGAPTWTATVAAGGGTADNFLVVNMNPNPIPTTLTVGPILHIRAATSVVAPTPGTGQILDDLLALKTPNQQVIANVQFVDPVTAALIMPAQTLPILQSGDPVVSTCNAAASDFPNKTIDVGAATRAAKTYFSSNGAINNPNSGYFNAGSITVSRAAGFTSFSYEATDSFTTVLTGDFSAFAPSGGGRGVFLSQDANCTTENVTGVVSNSPAPGTVTFTYTGANFGVVNPSTGFTAYVCAKVPFSNAVLIDATTITETTTFTRAGVVSTGGTTACPLLPLRYNGSVVDVYVINPASNPTAQSFIRVINPSDSAGTVTLTGIDDNGLAATAPITFVLGARRSLQINSDDLELGNAAKGLTGAWGNGTGKWRGTVTGEFANMLVQSLNRNSTDGTVTNLTDADNRGEQFWNAVFNNN